MATKKRSVKRKKHTHYGPVKKHRRRVNGLNPAVVSGTKRRKHRRKKVSGLTGNDFMDALLGTVVGIAVGVVYDKMAPITDAKTKHGLEAALGLGVAFFGSQKKNMFMLGAGFGLAADGIKSTAEDFGVITGMQNMMAGMGLTAAEPDAMLIEMNGMEQQKMMGDARGGATNVMSGAMPSVISSMGY